VPTRKVVRLSCHTQRDEGRELVTERFLNEVIADQER
jgi:hypothetical protein